MKKRLVLCATLGLIAGILIGNPLGKPRQPYKPIEFVLKSDRAWSVKIQTKNGPAEFAIIGIGPDGEIDEIASIQPNGARPEIQVTANILFEPALSNAYTSHVIPQPQRQLVSEIQDPLVVVFDLRYAGTGLGQVVGPIYAVLERSDSGRLFTAYEAERVGWIQDRLPLVEISDESDSGQYPYTLYLERRAPSE